VFVLEFQVPKLLALQLLTAFDWMFGNDVDGDYPNVCTVIFVKGRGPSPDRDSWP